MCVSVCGSGCGEVLVVMRWWCGSGYGDGGV